MTLQPILIEGQWRAAEAPDGDFQAFNPATGATLDDNFPISNWNEIETMLHAAQAAMAEIDDESGEELARFLETYADNIEARADELVAMAHQETALATEPRLRNVELPRTTNQLRQAAQAARNGDWRQATIDTKNNIRSMFAPLNGPVVVFGPNNFPFAFNGIAGGDFVAAIASGHAVIAKANPAHPKTTQLLAEAALHALQSTPLPHALVQLFYDAKNENGLKLVSHPALGATAFTGSRSAGMALKAAADKVHKPIYLEMSSVNPTFILSGALAARGGEIAKELSGSCLMAAGQFCTKPGLVVVEDGADAEEFISNFVAAFGTEPTPLLGKGSASLITETLERLQQNGAQLLCGGDVSEKNGFFHENTVLRATGEAFLKNPQALQTEAFGPVCLIITVKNAEQMRAVAEQIEGSLTGCIYSENDESDENDYAPLATILRPRVGRLLNDKAPTGVAVSPAMVHGGPPPSTGHAGFTSVGLPASLRRFAALHCYDNVRAHRLPRALQDKNPTGQMWRCIDGRWTQDDIL